MSIVATEIESIHGAAPSQVIVFYRCLDSAGLWHPYGPVLTSDSNFDPEAFKIKVADSVSARLAEQEAKSLVTE